MTAWADHLRRMGDRRATGGIRAVLIYLNGLTEHRFTAMYRFDDERLRNLYFYDRERPAVESCPDIPVLASYCVFVRASRHTFVTPDSVADGRVGGHPKRLEVRSYCGVPLVDEAGRMFGTVCHFDPRPLPISGESVALMEALAPLLAAGPAEPRAAPDPGRR